MKVLIVEDDQLQRMLLSDMLQRFAKVEVVEAVDGETAWQELERGLHPVLCCCDMRMPGMSGMELLRRVRTSETLADMPFIFVSMATETETIREAIAAGATDYIDKPFNLAKSRPVLEKVFAGVRQQQASLRVA